jgi:WD40 repeat protein
VSSSQCASSGVSPPLCTGLNSGAHFNTGSSAVAVTPDGLRVVYGGFDWTLKVRDLVTDETGHSSARQIDTGASIHSIALTPDGRSVIFGSVKGIGRWDLNSGGYWFQNGPIVNAVAVAPDGTRAVYGGCYKGRRSQPLSLWHLAEGGATTFPSGHDQVIYSVCITPDGNFALSGSDDKTIRIWDLITSDW